MCENDKTLNRNRFCVDSRVLSAHVLSWKSYVTNNVSKKKIKKYAKFVGSQTTLQVITNITFAGTSEKCVQVVRIEISHRPELPCESTNVLASRQRRPEQCRVARCRRTASSLYPASETSQSRVAYRKDWNTRSKRSCALAVSDEVSDGGPDERVGIIRNPFSLRPRTRPREIRTYLLHRRIRRRLFSVSRYNGIETRRTTTATITHG